MVTCGSSRGPRLTGPHSHPSGQGSTPADAPLGRAFRACAGLRGQDGGVAGKGLALPRARLFLTSCASHTAGSAWASLRGNVSHKWQDKHPDGDTCQAS